MIPQAILQLRNLAAPRQENSCGSSRISTTICAISKKNFNAHSHPLVQVINHVANFSLLRNWLIDQSPECIYWDFQVLCHRTKNWTRDTLIMVDIGTVYQERKCSQVRRWARGLGRVEALEVLSHQSTKHVRLIYMAPTFGAPRLLSCML